MLSFLSLNEACCISGRVHFPVNTVKQEVWEAGLFTQGRFSCTGSVLECATSDNTLADRPEEEPYCNSQKEVSTASLSNGIPISAVWFAGLFITGLRVLTVCLTCRLHREAQHRDKERSTSAVRRTEQWSSLATCQLCVSGEVTTTLVSVILSTVK